MGSVLRAGKALGSEVRRLSLREVRRAIGLRGDRSLSMAERVHRVRRRIKRLRALLLLARGDMGERWFERERAVCRRIGRALGIARDALVVLEAFDRLAEQARRRVGATASIGKTGTRALRSSLRGRLLPRLPGGSLASAHRAVLRGSGPMLEHLRERVSGWDLSPVRGPSARLTAERIWARGRAAMRRAIAVGRAEAFHGWRRRVKELEALAAMCRDRGPKWLVRRRGGMARLGGTLGSEHDLTVLIHRLRGLGGAAIAGPRTALIAEAERLRSGCRERAIRLGGRVWR